MRIYCSFTLSLLSASRARAGVVVEVSRFDIIVDGYWVDRLDMNIIRFIYWLPSP